MPYLRKGLILISGRNMQLTIAFKFQRVITSKEQIIIDSPSIDFLKDNLYCNIQGKQITFLRLQLLKLQK